MRRNWKKRELGITLVALVVTIVVLLILAGITINYVLGNNSVFKKATEAKLQTEIAKAREKLDVTFANAQVLKRTDTTYNQTTYLDSMMIKEIKGIKISEDIVRVDGYVFEIDRSIPKVEKYVGKESELVFPTITVTEPVLATDYRTASFIVTALEGKNGINKIEIWFAGEKIETLTKTYNHLQTEITENFVVNRNGNYTMKVYGDLIESVSVEVAGIVPAVSFLPNGSSEWKKQHTTKIIVKETGERVTSLKYKWTTSNANPPTENEFTQTCPKDNIITGKDFTGTYFLWILLTTETGKTNICGSEEFNFDNEGPTVTLDSTPASETSFILTVTSSDTQSGIAKYEFYIDGIKVDSKLSEDETVTYIWNGTDMVENKECYVEVFDIAGNKSSISRTSRTKLFHWKVYSPLVKPSYGKVYDSQGSFTSYYKACMYKSWSVEPTCDENGQWSGTLEEVYMGQLAGRWTWINGRTDGYIVHIAKVKKFDNDDMTITWDKIKRPEYVQGTWDNGKDTYTAMPDAFVAGIDQNYVKYEYLGIE